MKPMEVIPNNEIFNNDFVQLVLNDVRLLSSLKFGVQLLIPNFLPSNSSCSIPVNILYE